MYKEMTKESLIKEAQSVKDFVIVKGYDQKSLVELASTLKENKEGVSEIYWLNGGDALNYPSFSSIRLSPRFVIRSGGIRPATDGLIFLQSKPVILVIANFDKLAQEDQEMYLHTICKKEDNDRIPRLSLDKESIVILAIGKDAQEPQISYKLEARSIR